MAWCRGFGVGLLCVRPVWLLARLRLRGVGVVALGWLGAGCWCRRSWGRGVVVGWVGTRRPCWPEQLALMGNGSPGKKGAGWARLRVEEGACGCGVGLSKAVRARAAGAGVEWLTGKRQAARARAAGPGGKGSPRTPVDLGPRSGGGVRCGAGLGATCVRCAGRCSWRPVGKARFGVEVGFLGGVSGLGVARGWEVSRESCAGQRSWRRAGMAHLGMGAGCPRGPAARCWGRG